MNRRPTRAAVIAGAVAALARPAAAQNAALTELSVAIVSATAVEWHLMTADKGGFFRNEGLHVTFVNAGSPANVVNLLASGSVGLADTSTDSGIGAIAHGLPLKFIAPGFVPDPYTLVSAPGVTGWAQLKGKTVMLGPKLDVTGITFTRMAQAHGLTMNDFDVVVATSTTARYAALMSGNVAATMLNQPYDLLAMAKGMHRLAVAADYVKPWLFGAAIVNTGWAAANRGTAIRFLRAIRKAIEAAYARPDDAVAALVGSTNIDPPTAREAYDLIFRRWHAFDPALRIDPAALRAVASGSIASGIITAMPSTASIYDPSFVAEALR